MNKKSKKFVEHKKEVKLIITNKKGEYMEHKYFDTIEETEEYRNRFVNKQMHAEIECEPINIF